MLLSIHISVSIKTYKKCTVCVLESHFHTNSLWMMSRYYEYCCVKSGASMFFLTALMMSGWPRSVMTFSVMQHQGLFGLCLTSDLFENPDYPRSIPVTQLLHWPLNKANTLLTWWRERAFEKSLEKSHDGFFSHFNIIQSQINLQKFAGSRNKLLKSFVCNQHKKGFRSPSRERERE